ncbi:MAG: ABC transporter permease, partial [Kurthia sp.]|nr:ABC transporter permease [Kurthia sp.]
MNNEATGLFPNVDWEGMWQATLETLYMTGVSTIITFILGLVLGIILFLTAPHQLWENKVVNFLTGAIVNIFRSIPFVILVILLIPFTIFLMGTMRGAN